MDLPVNLVEWELFIPDRYRVDHFEGNAIARTWPAPVAGRSRRPRPEASGTADVDAVFSKVGPGQVVGRVTDSSGAPMPGATVTLSGSGPAQSAVTDSSGRYLLTNVPSGRITVTAQLQGFGTSRNSFVFDQRPRQADLVMLVGTLSETVTVTAAAPVIDTTSSSTVGQTSRADESRPQAASKAAQEAQAPSANVQNLQRPASGVLPADGRPARARRTGSRALVIDEETVVSFRYGAADRLP